MHHPSQWTYYPLGEPTTVDLLLSGVYILDDDEDDGSEEDEQQGRRQKKPKLMMLNQGTPVPSDKIEQHSLRRAEILRHLPLVVAQFDARGNLMEQNPESLQLFGGSELTAPNFVDRFVGLKEGRQAFQQILDNDVDVNVHLEAELYTVMHPETSEEAVAAAAARRGVNKAGSGSSNCTATTATAAETEAESLEDTSSTTTLPEIEERQREEAEADAEAVATKAASYSRWFDIKARKSKDPVTAEMVILYSARDISDIRAAKQETDRANLEKSEFFAVMAHGKC